MRRTEGETRDLTSLLFRAQYHKVHAPLNEKHTTNPSEDAITKVSKLKLINRRKGINFSRMKATFLSFISYHGFKRLVPPFFCLCHLYIIIQINIYIPLHILCHCKFRMFYESEDSHNHYRYCNKSL